jgi:hypothetical protein
MAKKVERRSLEDFEAERRAGAAAAKAKPKPAPAETRKGGGQPPKGTQRKPSKQEGAAKAALTKQRAADKARKAKAKAEATEVAETPVADPPPPVAKPTGSKLAKFKSKRGDAPAGVRTMLGALPVMRLSDANDFVRVHPDSAYTSDELTFTSVPVQGVKDNVKHIGDEDVLMSVLPNKMVERHALALCAMPHDRFFLGIVPTINLDNSWNRSTREGFELMKTRWVMLTSRKNEGVDAYNIKFAESETFVPEPKWPTASLDDLILASFKGRSIEDADHPALLRRRGAAQPIDVE